ncbi:MAG TPA: crosslink repair DNA glycosylase YcaQ family protein [Ktedonobacteraceae bacterium]|nr:crosslink repair DNA glycosylase YcaQ family protein [Ktedonobacteraceae bacterium]
MVLQLSREEARRFLAQYHFKPTDLPGVIDRLGTVQYDPLNPVGRNADLVFQARIPGYQVDDWQTAAYTDRIIYDAWDKQACLVPASDWPMRALVREKFRPYHDREILEADPEGAAKILATIDEQGPLSSLEFEDRERIGEPGSWSGSTRTKRILRSLWACGELVTHHRKGGRHYYDRPSRVIPEQHFTLSPLVDEAAYYRWIIMRRYKAAGILRPTAEAAIWSACNEAPKRKLALAQLVEAGLLTQLKIDELAGPYYAQTSALKLLDEPLSSPRVIFMGPLDSLLWDRKSLLQIFDFDYIWEVYKPAEQRKWGYYILPVFYGDRFVARVDSRLEKGTWTISRWWWEPDIMPNGDLLDALGNALENFLHYLRADRICYGENVDALVKQVTFA